jgi:hypothetical protein
MRPTREDAARSWRGVTPHGLRARCKGQRASVRSIGCWMPGVAAREKAAARPAGLRINTRHSLFPVMAVRGPAIYSGTVRRWPGQAWP